MTSSASNADKPRLKKVYGLWYCGVSYSTLEELFKFPIIGKGTTPMSAYNNWTFRSEYGIL